MPTRAGSGQASQGSQSEEEGTAEESSGPAAAELSLEGGSQGKGGGRGWGTTFHRLFWPLTETGGSERKGEEQVRTPGYKSTKTRLFLCVRNFAWQIKLDLELADRESEAWDMDRSLGRQGSSVPEERAEAGVRLLRERVDLPRLPPCVGWIGAQRQRSTGSVAEGLAPWQSRGADEAPGVLTPWLELLWVPPVLAGGRVVLAALLEGLRRLGVSVRAFPPPWAAAPLLSAPGGTRRRQPPSLPPSVYPQTDFWVPVGLCRGTGFPQIPQTLGLPENKTCHTHSARPPPASLPRCCIINRLSWDTFKSGKWQFC